MTSPEPAAVTIRGTWWRHAPLGGDPWHRPAVPASNRWQRGRVAAALYLADSPETAWAEWYRHLAESAIPPMQTLPRELWRWQVDLERVADLRSPEALAAHQLTADAVPELRDIATGLAHLFIRRTSASLTLNENASPDVQRDFESWFDAAVPQDAPYWTHTLEGPDDMPAHIKASLLGPALLPVSDGRLALGTWQGVYYASTATAAARGRCSSPCSAISRDSARGIGVPRTCRAGGRAPSRYRGPRPDRR